MQNFNWAWVLGPIVGAVIGYFTNLIAVKMLFFPLEEKRVFGVRIPFTPGIIPKEKLRLARKIGEAVGEDIFTKDDITKGLISDSIKNKIEDEIKRIIDELQSDYTPIKQKMSVLWQINTIEAFSEKSKKVISKTIYDKIREMNIGDTLSEEVCEGIKRKTKPSFLLSILMGDKVVDDFKVSISNKIDTYVDDKVYNMIYSKVDAEIDNLISSSPSDIMGKIDINLFDYSSMAVRIYEIFVMKHLEKLIDEMNISKIVEEKIIEMDVNKVEEIILSVLKKELSAIVNLGALIGFILGVVMIFV